MMGRGVGLLGRRKRFGWSVAEGDIAEGGTFRTGLSTSIRSVGGGATGSA